MITNEQVKVALDAYYYHSNVMREALKAYEQSKWIKFDWGNESTYPPYKQEVMLKLNYRPETFIGRFNGRIEKFTGRLGHLTNVDYWRPLPEFEE